MRTLVVIPTYQEAENIADVLARVRAVVPSADVLVVDDNSPDGTGDLAEASAREHGGISVLRRPKKEGLGPAYKAGFAQGLDAGYEVLVEMDADLSHDPSRCRSSSARSPAAPTSPSAAATSPEDRYPAGRGTACS